MTSTTELQNWLEQRSKGNFHRQLVVIDEDEVWGIQTAQHIISILEYKEVLWVGENLKADSIHNKQYREFLGQEFDTVVYNAWSGMRANSVCALSGTIKSGGLMILLCPKLTEWPQYSDPEIANRISYGNLAQYSHSYFFSWLISNVKTDDNLVIANQRGFFGKNISLFESSREVAAPFKTVEQMEAVEAVERVAMGHRKRPLIIRADRGRGKSSALGIAAAFLVNGSKKKIVVTAPSKNHCKSVWSIFDELADRELNHHLAFWPVDKLIEEKPNTELLLVDEAAAIPPQHLLELVKNYHRMVFSTTIHGYEGSGRGFDLRFKESLLDLCPDTKEIALTQPIRWSVQDPIEAFWFKVFAQKPLSENLLPAVKKRSGFSLVSQQELVEQPHILFEVFNLLVDAHYQTSPDDLVGILDTPNCYLFSLFENNILCGVALVAIEGNESLSELSEEIVSGKRRPNGHMLPQQLCHHFADEMLCKYMYARVMRIAVNKTARRNGNGSRMLTEVRKWAEKSNIDFLGTTFGASDVTLGFWIHNEFTPVKIGLKKETSTGENNVTMLLPLSKLAESQIEGMEIRFAEFLNYHLPGRLKHLPVGVALTLLKSFGISKLIEEQEYTELNLFALGLRKTELVEPILEKLLIDVAKSKALNEEQKSLILNYSGQSWSPAELQKAGLIEGKKALQEALQTIVKLLLDEV